MDKGTVDAIPSKVRDRDRRNRCKRRYLKAKWRDIAYYQPNPVIFDESEFRVDESCGVITQCSTRVQGFVEEHIEAVVLDYSDIYSLTRMKCDNREQPIRRRGPDVNF